MGFSPTSVPEGFQRANGKPFGAPVGAYPLPRLEHDAPTTARDQGLQPYGALTLFFRWRKKSVQKKASGTATPGKSPLLPIFERGSSQCRAQFSRRTNSCYRARSCSLFSSFKKGKAFSLRCLSPLCFPAVGAGQAQPMQIGMLRRKLGGFAASISRPLFHLTAGGGLIQPALLGMLRYGWDGFAVPKTGLLFSSAVGAILAQPAQLGIILCSLDIFVT